MLFSFDPINVSELNLHGHFCSLLKLTGLPISYIKYQKNLNFVRAKKCCIKSSEEKNIEEWNTVRYFGTSIQEQKGLRFYRTKLNFDKE